MMIRKGEKYVGNIFTLDERLGILIPELTQDWDEYSLIEQEHILLRWEEIRGRIPDRIKDLEKIINRTQSQLNEEGNFARSCQLNSEIAELASTINDLWIWYRAESDVSGKTHM